MTILSFAEAKRAKVEAKNREYFDWLRETVALCGNTIKYSKNPLAVAEADALLKEIGDWLDDAALKRELQC